MQQSRSNVAAFSTAGEAEQSKCAGGARGAVLPSGPQQGDRSPSSPSSWDHFCHVSGGTSIYLRITALKRGNQKGTSNN